MDEGSGDALSDRTWSPPDSLAGKLERGLGKGFLEALEAPRVEVHALLTECILDDPRWDHQLDCRDWYYGELARRTELPVAVLADALVQQGREDPEGKQWVTLDVLGHLARHNNPEAVNALRDYVRYGEWWVDPCVKLGETLRPGAWDGLEEQVVARIEEDPHSVGSYILDAEPFLSWQEASGKVRELLAKNRETRRLREPVESLRSQSTARILASPLERPHDVAQLLSKRRSPADRRALAAALAGDDADQSALAMFALAIQGDASIEGAVIRFVQKQPEGKTWRRTLALRALVTLPASTLLPLARDWRDAEAWELNLAANRILEAHATEEDLPWIRGQLGRSDAEERMYATTSALRMIARFPRSGPFQEVRDLFSSFTYSYGRHFAAEALRVTDPDFPATLAVECLWDCEGQTRAIGAQAVELSFPGVRDRLIEIIADPCEDEAVTAAASARLHSPESAPPPATRPSMPP